MPPENRMRLDVYVLLDLHGGYVNSLFMSIFNDRKNSGDRP